MQEAFPLTWPDAWKRTPAHLRQRSSFAVTFAKARDDLYVQLEKMGAKRVILSTNIPVRLDGIPYANAPNPSDPGAALYFEYKNSPRCFACDKFKTVLENIRSIGLTIASIRAIERYGASEMMERAFKGFTALPERAGEYWREILGFAREEQITVNDVERQFKQLAHEAHPDKGGNVERWHQLVQARENARRDLGAR
jgi:hypothetical protein